MLVLASHGVVVAGPRVGEAFTDLHCLELAATLPVHARSTGGEPRTTSGAFRAKATRQRARDHPNLADRQFAAVRRILRREEPADHR